MEKNLYVQTDRNGAMGFYIEYIYRQVLLGGLKAPKDFPNNPPALHGGWDKLKKTNSFEKRGESKEKVYIDLYLFMKRYCTCVA